MIPSNESDLEERIQERGLNAPRLTPDHIESIIKDTQYYVFPGTTMTVCCLTLANGSNVIGESACASPENFNVETGQEKAYERARAKIWELEGYLLRQRLHEAELFRNSDDETDFDSEDEVDE